MDWYWFYPVLFLTGLAAGFVDAIAGGGGLITLPVFLSLGFEPKDALGTNKLQATFGSGSAAFHFAHAGLVDLKECWTGIFCTAVGALAGTLLVQQLATDVLRKLIPWVLLAIAFYVFFRPRFGTAEVKPRMGSGAFHLLFGFTFGFYDGFLGPGTGTFWAMAYMLLLGFNMMRATAHTKVMNFTSNLVAFLLFLMAGHVKFAAGVAMGLGQLAGARLGSRVVIARGVRVIRPIFISVVVALSLKLLYDNFLRR